MLSIALLFNLLEKTYILLQEIDSRKALKSFAACSFVYPYRLQILFLVSIQLSRTIQREKAIRLTNSVLRRVRTSLMNYKDTLSNYIAHIALL